MHNGLHQEFRPAHQPALRRRTIRRVVGGMAVLLTFAGACGGDDIPTKQQFVDRIMANTKSQIEAMGSAAEAPYREFYGCIYDHVKDEPEQLEALQEGKSKVADDTRKALSTAAQPCVKKLTEAISKAQAEAAATTTTTVAGAGG